MAPKRKRAAAAAASTGASTLTGTLSGGGGNSAADESLLNDPAVAGGYSTAPLGGGEAPATCPAPADGEARSAPTDAAETCPARPFTVTPDKMVLGFDVVRMACYYEGTYLAKSYAETKADDEASRTWRRVDDPPSSSAGPFIQ